MPDETLNDAGVIPVPLPLPEGGGGAGQYGDTLADAGAGRAAPATWGHSSSGMGASAYPATAGSSPNYQVVRRIGGGGMGEVFLAKDRRTRRWVALKRLGAQWTRDAQLRARFETEAQAIASMSHFHVVALYTMDEDAAGPYLAMEYVAGPDANGPQESGGDDRTSGAVGQSSQWLSAAPSDVGPLPNPPLDLEQRVKRHGPLSPEEAIGLGSKVCSALSYAHRRGVVHRDIKPANILLTEDLEPKIADFGLALRGVQNASEESHTLAGARLLSIGYGAPEQEVDASKCDARADIYGLGATLWYAVTGQSPRHFRESEVPEILRATLIKAMAKDRELRYATAAEFAAALGALSHTPAGPPASVDDAPPPAPVPGRCPRCGHHRDPGAAGEAGSRKFCDNCGGPLVEPCLLCGVENDAWSKFCGSCGADLVAVVQRQLEKLQGERTRIFEGLQSSDFTFALAGLRQMGGIDHPRLQPFREWARELLPEAEKGLGDALKHADAQLELARKRMAAQGYASAATALESIPQPVRSSDATRLLAEAVEKREACLTLRADVRELMSARSHRGLREKVTQFLALQPADAAARKLLDDLDRVDRRAEDDAWGEASARGTVEAYCRFLENYPAAAGRDGVRKTIAPELRAPIVAGDPDARLRRLYLLVRTDALRLEDERHALAGTAASYATLGAAGGAIFGGVVAAVGGFWGAMIGGLIGGVAVAVLLSRRAA